VRSTREEPSHQAHARPLVHVERIHDHTLNRAPGGSLLRPITSIVRCDFRCQTRGAEEDR